VINSITFEDYEQESLVKMNDGPNVPLHEENLSIVDTEKTSSTRGTKRKASSTTPDSQNETVRIHGNTTSETGTPEPLSMSPGVEDTLRVYEEMWANERAQRPDSPRYEPTAVSFHPQNTEVSKDVSQDVVTDCAIDEDAHNAFMNKKMKNSDYSLPITNKKSKGVPSTSNKSNSQDSKKEEVRADLKGDYYEIDGNAWNQFEGKYEKDIRTINPLTYDYHGTSKMYDPKKAEKSVAKRQSEFFKARGKNGKYDCSIDKNAYNAFEGKKMKDSDYEGLPISGNSLRSS